jgi:hypothetical protein
MKRNPTPTFHAIAVRHPSRSSSPDTLPFSARLRRIAALLDDEADRCANGRLGSFFRDESDRLRRLAAVGVGR